MADEDEKKRDYYDIPYKVPKQEVLNAMGNSIPSNDDIGKPMVAIVRLLSSDSPPDPPPIFNVNWNIVYGRGDGKKRGHMIRFIQGEPNIQAIPADENGVIRPVVPGGTGTVRIQSSLLYVALQYKNGGDLDNNLDWHFFEQKSRTTDFGEKRVARPGDEGFARLVPHRSKHGGDIGIELDWSWAGSE